MTRWAKLDERIAEDLAVADLLVDNPLAAALFQMSLPRADLYGILPGDVRSYRARVSPAARLSDAQVAGAIAALLDAGLYHAYTVNGHAYLYIRRFHRYQDVRWGRIGPPDTPLPDCWDCPQELRDSPNYARLIGGNGQDTPDYSGTIPDYPGYSRLDTDVDVDTDVDTARGAEAPQPRLSNGGNVRGPSLKGNLVLIRDLIKSRNWPKDATNRFLYALRDVCDATDTQERLLAGSADEVAGIVLESLKSAVVDVAELNTYQGRAWVIKRLVQSAEKLATCEE